MMEKNYGIYGDNENSVQLMLLFTHIFIAKFEIELKTSINLLEPTLANQVYVRSQSLIFLTL